MSTNPPDKRILSFIRRHHLMTLATQSEGKPWTASCFYAFLPEQVLFVFTTATDTLHGKQMLGSDDVAVNIALETRVIGKIQGLQMGGKAFLLEDDTLKAGKKAYLLRFPVAAIMDTLLWGFSPALIKFTDNKLGFGRKLYWYRHPDSLPHMDIPKEHGNAKNVFPESSV